MIKNRISYVIILVAILVAAPVLAYLFHRGEVSLQNFPLHEKWTTKLNGRVETLSTDGDKVVFARTINRIYAIDVISGELIWQNDLSWQGIPQPPIISNGIVYLADGKSVWAFDQINGNVKWKYELPSSSASVDLVSGNFVVVEMSSDVIILQAADGTHLWDRPDCRYGKIQTYAVSSHLFSPCIDGLTKMDISTGKVEQVTDLPFIVATVAFQDDIMYYSPDRNSVAAINLQNQSEVWVTSFRAEGYRKFIVLGEYLSVTGSDRFCIIKRETGDLLWCSEYTKPQNPQ